MKPAFRLIYGAEEIITMKISSFKHSFRISKSHHRKRILTRNSWRQNSLAQLCAPRPTRTHGWDVIVGSFLRISMLHLSKKRPHFVIAHFIQQISHKNNAAIFVCVATKRIADDASKNGKIKTQRQDIINNAMHRAQRAHTWAHCLRRSSHVIAHCLRRFRLTVSQHTQWSYRWQCGTKKRQEETRETIHLFLQLQKW